MTNTIQCDRCANDAVWAVALKKGQETPRILLCDTCYKERDDAKDIKDILNNRYR